MLLGEANVGKTSLIRLLRNDTNLTTSVNNKSEVTKEITKHQLKIADEEYIPVAFVSEN